MKYNSDYFLHLTPLLFVEGTDIQNEPLRAIDEKYDSRLTGKWPTCKTPLVHEIAESLRKRSNSLEEWHESGVSAGKARPMHVEFVPRNCYLPQVKEGLKYTSGDTHSLLSPKNEKSYLNPDGILNYEWIQKYAYFLPSTFLSLYEIDDSISDEALIEEINDLRISLLKHNIRLIVTVVPGPGNITGYDERIASIRRATGLGSRTGLLYLPIESSDDDTSIIVESLWQLAYNQSAEFYMNISRSIRKKRNNGPKFRQDSEGYNGTERLPLSTAGWDARYSLKVAMMAEFRQDFDSATSLYENSYDLLLELLENLSVKENTQRWVDTRLWLDVVAYRIVRACLYKRHSNLAYRKFDIHLGSIYRAHTQAGLSTEEEPYLNWLANQYVLLAKLVKSAGNVAVPVDHSLATGLDEKYPNSRLPRAGYLFLEAAELLQGRNSSSNLESTRKEAFNDPFFSDGPDLDYFDLLKDSRDDFVIEPQKVRSLAYIQFQLGEILFERRDYKRSFQELKSAYFYYKSDNYRPVLLKILSRMHECAQNLGEDFSVDSLSSMLEVSSLLHRDLPSGKENLEIKGSIEIFKGTFTFEAPECHVGLSASFQLTLVPQVHGPVLDLVEVHFTGVTDEVVRIENNSDVGSGNPDKLMEIAKGGKADLRFRDYERFFHGSVPAKNLGNLRLKKVFVTVNNGYRYNQEVNISHVEGAPVKWVNSGSCPRHLRIDNPLEIAILPRPSRVEISSNAPTAIVRNERFPLKILATNKENEPIGMKLEACLVLEGNESKDLVVSTDDTGELLAGSERYYTVEVDAPSSTEVRSISIEAFLTYHLVADEETTTKDKIRIDIPISQPFRADFEVSARFHPDDWPSLFVQSEGSQNTTSPIITKRWDFTSWIRYLGDEEVELLGARLKIEPKNEAECKLLEEAQGVDQIAAMKHNSRVQKSYIFDCKKVSGEDVRNVVAKADLTLDWRRKGGAQVNKFLIAPVRLNLPLYEPRVIVGLSMEDDDSALKKLILHYHIENATSYVLTYAVAMGSSPGFAFDGPKMLSLRVLPFTKRVLNYTLTPLKGVDLEKGSQLPTLKIHDTFYKRSLVVISAHPWIKAGESSTLILKIS